MNIQQNPFEDRWPLLKEMFETDGAQALVTFISAREDLLERRALFLMASQRISQGQDLSRGLLSLSRQDLSEHTGRHQDHSALRDCA